MPAMQSLAQGAWLNPHAIVITEQHANEEISAPPAYMHLETRVYGDTQIGIFQYSPG